MRGFTLLELIISIGLLVIIGSIVVLNLAGFRSQRELELATENLVAYLRDAQSRAISQQASSKWGVHFDAAVNDNDSYSIFSGNDYATGSVQNKIFLPLSLKFSDPAEGTTKDIIFSKVSGATSPAVVKLALSGNESSFFTININANGVIDYAK
ncbi:MAG: prepilin-type N-terminal cleavage/methylation domain-containing protein [Candidatus Harrisonbacteria bacterium]|nr:prepilin-type N-terminal cleavage/methylation domain-containing protein [Candidatus Harrisonbacteria bacterium]